ncbi:MAG TPA: RNA polymerase sigma factor [Ignavibacteriaceae bacterium]|nr:RNA polymerase sigma factor [Ignavibacteriaceae bacterium]
MNEENLLNEWTAGARCGDKSCFGSLISFYHPRLLAYALKICRYSNIAEDALQDAYISAFVHRGEINEPNNFFYWLRTIVKRSCLRSLSERKSSLPLSAKLIDSKIDDKTLEDEIEKKSSAEFLMERINHLSEPLKAVVLLRYFTIFNSYENISVILGIAAGTVKSRLNEAKKQLKKIWRYELSDLPENIRKEADYWNEFYSYSFKLLHHDLPAREKFIEHMIPELQISFTSGLKANGRKLIEKEIDEDIKYGTSYKVAAVFNLKDTGIIEFENINSPDYPDRCPPLSTLIYYRKTGKAHQLLFHNAEKQ